MVGFHAMAKSSGCVFPLWPDRKSRMPWIDSLPNSVSYGTPSLPPMCTKTFGASGGGRVRFSIPDVFVQASLWSPIMNRLTTSFVSDSLLFVSLAYFRWLPSMALKRTMQPPSLRRSEGPSGASFQCVCGPHKLECFTSRKEMLNRSTEVKLETVVVRMRMKLIRTWITRKFLLDFERINNPACLWRY